MKQVREYKREKKKENPLINISFNIIIPAIVMTKFDDWLGLSPTIALVLALAFPLGYGLIDLIRSRNWNIFSCVGFFSILVTGGIGLLRLPSEWIPIKEAAVPLIFCIFIVMSLFEKRTILEKFLFNENLLNAELVYSRIRTEAQKEKFQSIMRVATLILSSSFILSAILNYVLAKLTVQSATDSPNFTKELGTMLALSYPVIVLPCMIVLYGMLCFILKKLSKLADLPIKEILNVK